LVEDIEATRARWLRLSFAPHDQHVPTAKSIAWLGCASIGKGHGLSDDRLRPCSRQAGDLSNEEMIETMACQLRLDDEPTHDDSRLAALVKVDIDAVVAKRHASKLTHGRRSVRGLFLATRASLTVRFETTSG